MAPKSPKKGKKKLTKEELGIHEALSPASGSPDHVPHTQDPPPQEPPSETTLKNDTALSIDDLVNLVKSATAIGIQE